MKKILIFTLIIITGFTLYAEDINFEDDLFADDDIVTEDSLFSDDTSSSDTGTNLFENLLGSEDASASITGSYSFGLSFTQIYNKTSDTFTPWGLTVPFTTSLELSARPDTTSRYFLGLDLDLADTTSPATITEAFGDFTFGNDYFVRVGKQTLNWGVGYFFSPANLLNIGKTNPLDAEADLEGPVAVKFNKSFGTDNLSLYAVMDPDSPLISLGGYSSSYNNLQALSYAARFETVVGKAEIGTGAVYSFDSAKDPAAMLTLSLPLYTDVNFFSETVATYSKDQGNVSWDATAGISVLKTLASLSDTSLTLFGQYNYDQEGKQNIGGSVSDLRHQVAGMLSVNCNDVSSSVLGIWQPGNDTTTLVYSLGYALDDNISVKGSLTDLISNTPFSSTSYTFSVSLGGGDF